MHLFNALSSSFLLGFFQVVLLAFKPYVSLDRQKAILAQFEGLADVIPQVKSLEWGTDISIENKTEGYTHAFLLTFHSPKDRTTYVNSEVHQAFVHSAISELDQLLILDYQPKSVKTDARPFL
jgi:hypothetical protein